MSKHCNNPEEITRIYKFEITKTIMFASLGLQSDVVKAFTHGNDKTSEHCNTKTEWLEQL